MFSFVQFPLMSWRSPLVVVLPVSDDELNSKVEHVVFPLVQITFFPLGIPL